MAKRVLLINPKPNRSATKVSSYFPTGLAYISSYLRSKDLAVAIMDLSKVPDTSISERLGSGFKEFMPDIVGIGCLFSVYFPGVVNIARLAKRIDKNIPICIGGLHPTLFHRNILSSNGDIDYVILGEGERSFYDLIRALKGQIDKKDVDGLAYRMGQEVMANEKKYYIDDLDNLPFPDFERFDMDNYFYHYRYSPDNRGMSIITSRSCPNRCSFCSMFHAHGPRWRSRSAENVLDEIQFLYEKYKVRHLQFMDDNMTFNKERSIDIFRKIVERGLKVTIDFPNGLSVNTLDDDIIFWMKKAGCIEVRLAVESGSVYMRNHIMRKRLSDEKIFEVIEACNKHRIAIVVFFVLGMPGENNQTVADNMSFVKKLKGNRGVDFISPNYATPFPGTDLFETCMKDELINRDTVQSIIDGSISLYDRPIIKLKDLSEKELIDFRNRLWRVSSVNNLPRIAMRYLKPTKANYRLISTFFKRFFIGY